MRSAKEMDLAVGQAGVRADRERLKQLLLEAERKQRQSSRRIVPRSQGHGLIPLSYAQERLWFLDQLGLVGAAYNVPLAMRLEGDLDRRALELSFRELLRRHEGLRTRFAVKDGAPHQLLDPPDRLTIDAVDLRHVENPQQREYQLRQCMMREQLHQFDLREGPLLRVVLVALGDREHALLLTMHHIACDGWSLGLLIRELGALYAAHTQGEPSALPEPTLQYADYAIWQRQSGQQALFDQQLQYWKERLRGAPPQLELPTDRPRPPMESFAGGKVRFELPASLVASLRELARQEGVTLFMLMLAAYQVLLSRWSGQEDIVVGSPIAGRNLSELEPLVGFFVNTLVLRTEVAAHFTFRQLLRRVKEVTLGAYAHQELPFEVLAKELRPERNLARQPIFQVMLALQNYPQEQLQLPGLTWTRLEPEWVHTQFDLTLYLYELGERVTGTLGYATDLFEHETIERMAVHLQVLLEASATNPDCPVSRLPLLGAQERQCVTADWNTAEHFEEQLIHHAFEQQARRVPDRVAVTFGNETLTYAELDSRAEQLACFLRRHGVGPDELVAICVERGVDMVVGLLGILKAGGAYVPLDPNYPPERLAYMLEDAAPRLILTHERQRERFASSAHIVALDTGWDEIVAGGQESRDSDMAQPRPHHLAYVIYTSGSTGRPKGVMVEHRSVTRLFAATARWFSFNEHDVWTLFHSVAFDFSVWELWGALLYGGRIVVVPYLTARSPRDFYELICEQGVTVLNQTPSAFMQLSNAQTEEPAKQHSLRVVIFGGEALEVGMLRPWVERNGVQQPQLVNMYGITETTVHVTYRPPLTREDIEAATGSLVGRPIPDLQVYLLDSHGNPVPVGVAGEIYVGGAGVARGYLNRPDLTAQRFQADPFSADPQARIYKSGDLGRWRPGGTIEYLGRNDNQVKIRGFRIELGEIESQLVRHQRVKEVAVVAREDVPGEKRLVAYVVPSDEAAVNVEELRAHLREALPEYMVPSAFVTMSGLPLTSNGKLDRKALPAPDLEAYTSRRFEPPQGEVEEILAGVWQGLLKVSRVGRHDNFFELGGHSLMIVQLMERLRRLGLSAPMRRVYESPRLAELARALASTTVEQPQAPPNLIPPGCEAITPEMLPLVKLNAEQIASIERSVPGGALNIQDVYPLAPLQEGILFHHMMNEQAGDIYLSGSLLYVASRERLDELIRALQAVIDRHDVLRTAILWEQLSQPVQVVYRHAPLQVERVTLDPSRDPAAAINDWLEPGRQRLDLRRAPLMRMRVAAEPSGNGWHVLLHLHHIVGDNTSKDIVLGELAAFMQGTAHRLPPPVPYRNHVAQTLASAASADAETFFRTKLGDIDEPTAPFGLLNVHADGSLMHEASEQIDPSLAQKVLLLARRYGVSAATLFHAAWGLVVAHTSGRNDVVFGTVLLGRLQGSAGAQRILGMFINTLPLRLQLEQVTATELIEQTQRELVELLGHEQVSLAVAQRCSGVVGSPLFSALFNYRHSVSDAEADLSVIDGVEVRAGRNGTNYPITLSVDDLGSAFKLTAQTDPAIEPLRITAYVHTALRSLTEALEQAPDARALTLRILPVDECRQLAHFFNDTHVEYPREKLVHQLFEEQAQRAPETTAAIFEQQALSYAELDSKTDRLAAYLRQQGVGPDTLVGICVERSIEMVVGVLAILKAGGAYVPFDPSYPDERLRYMLDDAALDVVLIQERMRSVLPATKAQLVPLDGVLEERSPTARDPAAADLELTSRSLLYVIYTSGSTGKPKATTMGHAAMVNLIEWHRRTLPLNAGQRVLQFAALSFDVAFQEMFSTLCTGGTLVLLNEWVRRDARALLELLSSQRIERLFVPPLMLQSIGECFRSADVSLHLRDVITAGEQLRISPEIRDLFVRLEGCRLHNHYGPTETHVVTSLTLDGDCNAWPVLPSLGRPLANTQIHILNAHRQPVPIGVPGEIYIAGEGLARGYLRRPEITAQRFITDSLGGTPGARMYRTGDLGRWLADGSIEYLGRNDHQVKVRGYRIELGEIEAQLAKHSGIREAAVVVREDVPGDKRIVAYVIYRDGAQPDADELRSHLKALLPEYMTPAAFVVLASFPLTPSGKLDRRVLPAPELTSYASRSYEAPQGDVEQALAGIWSEVLRIARIGREDNFFELGGHSLYGIRVVVKIQERFAVHLPIVAVFQHPTIREMADVVAALRGSIEDASNRAGFEFDEGIL